MRRSTDIALWLGLTLIAAGLLWGCVARCEDVRISYDLDAPVDGVAIYSRHPTGIYDYATPAGELVLTGSRPVYGHELDLR